MAKLHRLRSKDARILGICRSTFFILKGMENLRVNFFIDALLHMTRGRKKKVEQPGNLWDRGLLFYMCELQRFANEIVNTWKV